MNSPQSLGGDGRQKELQPLRTRKQSQGERKESFNTWASPTSRHPGEAVFPEEIQVKFSPSKQNSSKTVFWCSRTETWHCQVGTELVISLIPVVGPKRDQEIHGAFTLSWSSADPESGAQELPHTFQRDAAFQTFSCTWIGQSSGQTDFHVKWTGDQPMQQQKRNVRVFANAASLCVHPLWQHADVTSELVNVEAEFMGNCNDEDVDVYAWFLCCRLQLRECMRCLRCPTKRIPVLESIGPSFGGLGPDPSRWKPSLGVHSTVVKCEVDINKGELLFTLKFSQVSKLEAGKNVSLTLVDRCTCVHVKASPSELNLKVPSGHSKAAHVQTELDVGMHQIPNLPGVQLRHRTPTLHTAPGIADTNVPNQSKIAPVTDRQHDNGLSSDCRGGSPAKHQILLAIRKAEKSKQEAAKDLMNHPGSPSSPRSPGSPGSLSPRSPGSGPVKAGRVVLEPVPCKLSPRSDTPLQELNEPRLEESQLSPVPMIQTVSTLLQHVGTSTSTSDATSPRRYMPSEPLPNYTGWSKKKKSKSKSPSKKQRDFAKNYW